MKTYTVEGLRFLRNEFLKQFDKDEYYDNIYSNEHNEIYNKTDAFFDWLRESELNGKVDEILENEK